MPPTVISTLSLHDALPILNFRKLIFPGVITLTLAYIAATYMFQFRSVGLARFMNGDRAKTIDSDRVYVEDRKSTRLNSSHVEISYAVFCLKKQSKEDADRL